jgi:hypothetical protein
LIPNFADFFAIFSKTTLENQCYSFFVHKLPHFKSKSGNIWPISPTKKYLQNHNIGPPTGFLRQAVFSQSSRPKAEQENASELI